MSISKKSVSSPAVSSQPEPQQASQPAPHQASPEQVEQVIASALPLTGMIPVVEAPASPDAQGRSSRARAASPRRCALPA